MSQPRATLKTIAEHTGFSVSAVSQALRGTGHLSPETLELIRSAARNLGYQPNLFASGLRTHPREVTGTNLSVGIIRANSNSAHYPPNEFLVAFRNKCKASGAYLTEEEEPPTDRFAALLRKWKNKGVQAICVSGQGRLVLEAPELLRNFAVVVIGRYSTLPFTTIASESFTSVERLGEEAVKRGYRRIGFALCRHDFPLLDDRERIGALEALRHLHGQKLFTAPFLGAHKDESGFISWVKTEKPDAVIGFHAGHCYNLIENEWRVPEDIGFATLHVSTVKEIIPMTGMSEDFEGMAEAALRMADSHVRYNVWGMTPGSQWHLLPRLFQEGQTLPPRI